MEPELTLDKAKSLICQREAVREQQEVLKEPTKEDSSLDAIRKPPLRRKLPSLPAMPSRSVPLMPPPPNFQLCR